MVTKPKIMLVHPSCYNKLHLFTLKGEWMCSNCGYRFKTNQGITPFSSHFVDPMSFSEWLERR